MLWLVGQYARAQPDSTGQAGPGTIIPGMHDWAPDVLRIIAKSFSEEVKFFVYCDSICFLVSDSAFLQSETVQLQALTLAAKLLVTCPPPPPSAPSTPALGQLPTAASTASHKIALLTQYVFAQAASNTVSYNVRDRARTLGALVRGVSKEVYRASVAKSSPSLLDDSLRGEELAGTDDYSVEVSAEDWERQARSANGVLLNGNTAAEPADDGDEEADVAAAGGVTLRVEQVRLVLFEGKSSASLGGSSGELS